jgi:hypothetical protein
VKLSRSRTVTGALAVAALVTAGVGVAQPASAATKTATTSGAAADQRCARPLPSAVIGDPGLKAGAASGARVWHDGSGWHVRVTHAGSGTQVFRGVVTSPQPITAHSFRFEKGDSYRVSNHGHTLAFTLVNHGAIDGIDFTDRCAVNTRFSFARDGHRLPATDVYLGASQVHPLGDPFLVQRSR